MPAFKDLTGLHFSHWTVLRRDPETKVRVHWLCLCVCGAEKAVSGIHLTGGKSKSCGCVRPHGEEHPRYKHGQSGSPMFVLWMGMINRCANPAYHNHHGKGIKVCERWHDFSAFVADVGPRPSPQHSLDRWPDATGDYEPSNCRWATAKEQMRNMSRNLLVDCDGQQTPLAEACERKGVNYDAAKWRVKNGYRFDVAP